ncbi:MAG: hypothetical protein WKG32_03850 [Gemmatimonadaceae bacterium]
MLEAPRLLAAAILLACVTRTSGVVSGTAARAPAVVLAPSPVRVTFTAQSDSFASARDEYEALWRDEGPRIVRVMEQVSGLRFDSPPYADTAIGAVVFEGVSNSGYRATPMRLRASYPHETKQATLVHELGHRLQTGIAHRDEDEHEILCLWLYDTWTALWGQPFADAQVRVERERGGPYPRAGAAALALDSAARTARFTALVRRPSIHSGLP